MKTIHTYQRSIRMLRACLVAGMVVVLATSGFGALKTWVPTIGGSWSTASNWSPSGVPVAGDYVSIPTDQSNTITNVPTISLDTLRVSGNCSLTGASDPVVITVTADFYVHSGKILSLGNGNRINFILASTAKGNIQGTVTIYSGSTNSYFRCEGDLVIALYGLINDTGGSNNSDFILTPGATLRIFSTAGITTVGTAAGNIQTTGARTFDAAARYTYDGVNAQVTGTGFPTNLTGQLLIANTAGVTLVNANITITTGTLYLYKGTFTINPGGTQRLSLGNDATIIRRDGSINSSGVLQGTGTYDVNYISTSKTSGPELSGAGLRNVTVNINSGETLSLDGPRSPDGNITLTTGTFLMTGSNLLGAAPVIMNGGTFSTGVTTGYNQTTSTLGLTENSTIAFGTGSHTITFTNSSGTTWTTGKTLTITGWQGYWNGSSGTNGKLFFGNNASGLTTAQLAQIQFYNGSSYFPARILPGGEVVPYASEGLISGIPGKTLDFDGIDEYVQLSSILPIGSSSNTFECWVKIPEVGTNGLLEVEWVGTLLGNYDNPVNVNYEITDEGKMFFHWKSGEVRIWGTTDLRDNQWHHLAFIRDTDADIMLMYIDGEVELTQAPTTGNSAGSNLVLTTTHRLGCDNRASGRHYLHGKLEEVRIWNIARTQEQIKESMHLPLTGSETGLISYWQFNEADGPQVVDAITGNNGTLVNMDNSDRVTSTIPFGTGYSDSQTEATGTPVVFANTGLTVDYSTQNSAEVTVSRINLAPNLPPAGPDAVFDNQYWAVNRYGTGSFDADLTFAVSEDVTADDESHPYRYRLYSRAGNSDEAWTQTATATAVDAAGDKVTFEGITTFSQFIIGKYDCASPPAFSYNFSDITCFDAGNGTITINASGGATPYEYRYKLNSGSYGNWTTFNANLTGEDIDTEIIDNLSPGDYTIELKDANGCLQINCTGP